MFGCRTRPDELGYVPVAGHLAGRDLLHGRVHGVEEGGGFVGAGHRQGPRTRLKGGRVCVGEATGIKTLVSRPMCSEEMKLSWWAFSLSAAGRCSEWGYFKVPQTPTVGSKVPHYLIGPYLLPRNTIKNNRQGLHGCRIDEIAATRDLDEFRVVGGYPVSILTAHDVGVIDSSDGGTFCILHIILDGFYHQGR